MVIGGGVLLLPGLAYEEAGRAAVWAWALAALVSAPLLVIVATLGARHPAAGGIAGFVEPSLGRRASRMTEMLLLSAVTGGAGLIIVGGNAVGDWVGSDTLVLPVAFALLAVSVAVGLRGAAFAGSWLRAVSAVFIVALLAVALAGAIGGTDGAGMPGASEVGDGVGTVGLVFFAFVGWELMASMSEEFVNPRRDFPRAIALSFGIVAALYLLLAISVQQTLSLDDPNVDSSPVAATAELLWGEFGRILVSTIGVVIVTANIAGVLVAFSRLIFASARSGLLPRTLTRTDRRGTPVTAVLVTASVFALLAIAEQLGWVTQATLFRLAASAFFATFVVATIAFIAETTGAVRLFGFGALAISVAVLASFGWFALYPLAVGAVALATTQRTQST